MDAYIYQADIYCEDCGKAIRERIATEGEAPADPDNEQTYDSHDFPKGPFSNGGGEADSPQHCGNGPECLNAIEIGGIKVGAFLENDLTSYGIEYVKNAVLEGGEVAEFWRQEYEQMGYDFNLPKEAENED